MLQLTLIRHAKSSWDQATLSDYKRPLNQRGLDNAPLMGKILKAQGIQFDLIVSSPAIRAATTSELLATELDYPADKVVFDKTLYGAETGTLLEVVHALPNNKARIAIVAHNPGLTEFCNYLCNAGINNLPTCSVACIHFDMDDWSAIFRDTGTLQLYEFPRKHTDQDTLFI